MHQITDNKYIFGSPLKILLVCKVLYTQSVLFYDNRVRSLLVCKVVFEMTAGNTVEICQKYEIYHEIYNMQLIA